MKSDANKAIGNDTLRLRLITSAKVPRVVLSQASQLIEIAGLAGDIARTAKCRVGERATKTHALIDKGKLNKLKRRLRKLSPGCLGKE